MIVELTNGSIRLSLNTGVDTAKVAIGRGLNDGAWHLITVRVSGFQATISVDIDTCSGSDCLKTVITTRDSTSEFSGLPYLGSVDKLAPQITQELVTDGTFVGCIKVFITRKSYNVLYTRRALLSLSNFAPAALRTRSNQLFFKISATFLLLEFDIRSHDAVLHAT